MGEEEIAVQTTTLTASTNITVREAIAKLAQMEDMDAEVCFTFHNSDPIPVTDISDNADGQVVFSS